MGTGGRVIFRRGHGGRRRRRLDGEEDDEDDEEYVVDEEEEEEEEENYDEVAAGDDSASADEEEEEEEEEEEDEIGESDAEFEEEEEFCEEEEFEIETPRPKRPAKASGRFRKGKPEEDEEFSEGEEFEIETPRPKRPAKASGSGRKGKPAAAARSRRRRQDEDEDYEEEFEEEEEEEEEEEDEDFDPDVDEEEFDEEEEEEELGAIRTKKVRVRKELGKRKPATKRGRRRRKKKNSRVSKRKAPAQTKKAAGVRRRRKRSVIDDYEDEEEEEDEDFIVKDRVEVNRRPKKKAKVWRKKRASPPVLVVDTETWPSVDSDSSDFEFVTSDEEFVEKDPVAVEPARIKGRKGRRKRMSGSESSDSDYIISEEELRDFGVTGPPEVMTLLAAPPRRAFVGRKGEEKGKEKEAEEFSKPMCGICLSEEQQATVQGVLNCCSHYFCFACIMEWSKVESRCPLCKRRFTTITKSSKADLGLGLRKAVIRVEKRDQVYQPTEEEMRRWLDPYENVVCIECNQGGDDNLMLLCDICDSSAHTYCVGLGREVPEGNWYCGGCRSGGEGPSFTQVQDRVVYQGENNNGPVDHSSETYGTAARSGMFQRPPPINTQPSLQEIDLNLSPRDLPEEDQPAESHVSTGGVSTPSGRRATLSGRRAIHQHIRILLSRPRTPIRPDVWHNGIQHNGTIPGIGQNQGNVRASTEVSSSQTVANVMQNQQNSSPFVQSRSNFTPCTYRDGSDFQHIEGAKEQVQHMVKSNIKRLCTQSPLEDHSAFKSIARRATHTILAACGIEHNRDMVVTTPHPPSNCRHVLHGQEPAFLIRNCCSSCFGSFVNDVVKDIINIS